MHALHRLTPGRCRLLLATLTAGLAGLAFLLAPGAALHSAAEAPAAPRLELRSGDHVCLIGNTLADRMQHDGWLETLVQSRFPKLDLTFRNLGFSGDELNLRLRSASFGSPDQWLGRCQADVVLAFFGYNESFAGPAGLERFKKELTDFIKHTLAQKYNGKTAPRLVLFSPIAHENLHDRNLPDGKENNERLRLYTAAMAEVARANQVPFVDLFRPTQELYADARAPLTINGIHLTAEGNRQVAAIIDRALFAGGKAAKRDARELEKVRRAVLDKNFYWFNRYRTVDGYSIYGGRADLRFVGGQTNRVVMDREMEVLDVMTANRDKRIWAVAQGGDLKVDDSNTPPFIPVQTNKPGPLPGGKHVFLDGDEAIKRMTVGRGLKVNLFASEKQFPDLVNPVQMSFDARGRLWVAVWPTYPHWQPKEEMNDKLLVLEDTDGDGRADKCSVFADRLHCPTGFAFTSGGVLIAQAPDVLFLADTDGDGKADVRRRVLDGIDSADTHHTANSFVLDPGGAVYFQEGTFHHTQVESPYGPPRRCANAGVYRYEPRTQKFGVYITFGFANPHGHAFDRWGQDIVVDGTGANPYQASLFSGHLEFPQKHARPPQVYQQRTRPCPGMEVLASRHFPPDYQGNLLVANVIGFQGILRYKLDDQGAALRGTELEPVLSSNDPNFRPSDLKIGPDGTIYFLDWHNPIIGHMQHNLRDPSRDRTHGRIYRVMYENRPLLKPVRIAGAPVARLLDLLRAPEDRVRDRARIELGARDTREVMAALKTWLAGVDGSKDAEHEHHLLEALWLHQNHNVVDVALLQRVLGAKDFRARAAATRVLGYWHDRVPDALGLLRKLAADPHPRVRLEAVRAASFFTVPEAIEVPLISADHPADPALDFVRVETMKALDPYWRKAVADGRPIPVTSDAGARFLLRNLSTAELLKMKPTRAVDRELLFRPGVRDEDRQRALAHLAGLEGRSVLPALVEAIRKQDDQPERRDESVVFDLVRLLTGRPAGELKEARPELVRMATEAKGGLTRQLGFVALIAADSAIDPAWALAMKSLSSLRDLVEAMPLVRDPGQRAALYPKVAALLDGLPKALASAGNGGKRAFGQYVRIELPGRQRTLTLAEVEVMSEGRNVARGAKATQKNTAHGGTAGKAVDGNKDGSYGGGGQTHSVEGTDNPWWEVDLGREVPVDAVLVYNRTDGNLGNRLKNYTVKVLDAQRRIVFEKKKLPTPAVSARVEVSRESPEHAIRRAAMLGLTTVRGQEENTFKLLARVVQKGTDRHAAVQALLRIPASRWPKDEARPLLKNLLAYVRLVPVKERTSGAVTDSLQLADSLAARLPLAEARQVRKELGELGVRVVRIGTVTDQMLFDRERFVVKAGRPAEVLFENTDIMPHNFVIVQPGALAEVGQQAEAGATLPGAAERHYVPRSNKILLASRLLQPRDAQRLSFTAPTRPGVYPYVCTYPGHWRRMYGAMYVVADLDEYLADPEGYLAKHPLPVSDELLKFNRPRKEWKYEELVALVQQPHGGRSFANGRQMFQIATCVACHKMNGVGTALGPDLTQIDPKLTPADMLRDVLEPSFRINEKFQSWSFELKSGKVVTGLVVEETPQVVKVVENPLAVTQPTVLARSQIETRTKAPTSIMPKGLLDKLTREEILDLIAYVTARGDAKHKVFQGGHDHGHQHP